MYVFVYAQLCPLLWDLKNQSPLVSSIFGIFPGNTGVGCHFCLQGIFPTQGSNPRILHLLHWQSVLYTSSAGK